MMLLLLALPIQVGKVPLYTQPSFLAPVDTVLVRGMEVRVLTEQPGWKQVAVPALQKTGWIPATALERPKLLLPGKAGGKGDDKAVALASKGLASMLQKQEKTHAGAREALEHLDELSEIALRHLADFASEGGLR